MNSLSLDNLHFYGRNHDTLERGTNKKTALTVEQQVMITLRYFASGSFMQVIGDTLGYDKIYPLVKI